MNYSSTQEFSNATISCNAGFIPSTEVFTTCSRGLWVPAPENHVCTSVDLRLLENSMSRSDIDCPGDTISYNCTVQSSSPSLHLKWIVSFFEGETREVLYNNRSTLNNQTVLDFNTRISLVSSERGYLESVIVFTVATGVILNGTELECRIDNIDSETDTVSVNKSGMYQRNKKGSLFVYSFLLVPIAPTLDGIITSYNATVSAIVTFQWSLPLGGGTPAFIVDSYLIVVAPEPLSHPSSNVVNVPTWTVFLEYNVEYTVTIMAVNCVGESDPLVISDILYSELNISLLRYLSQV